MTHSFQSIATLKDMLDEASRLLATTGTPQASGLSKKIDELLRSLEETPIASAETEQEIVSIHVLAEIERKRAQAKA